MGVLQAIGVTAVAKLNATQPGDLTLEAAVAIAVLVGVAATWSAVDGWFGRRDRGRNWFVAGLIAGPLAGILGVVGRGLLVDQTGVAALGEALTGGAAFLALLVIVPAGVGMFVGNRIIGAARPSAPDDEDTQAPKPRTTHRSSVRRRRRGTITERKRAQQGRPTPAPRARN